MRLAVAPGTVRRDADIRFLGAAWASRPPSDFEARGFTTLPSLEVVARAAARVGDARFTTLPSFEVTAPVLAPVLADDVRVLRLAAAVLLLLAVERFTVRPADPAALRLAEPAPEAFFQAAMAPLAAVALVVTFGRAGAARRVVPSAVAVAVVALLVADPARAPVRPVEAVPVFDAALRERVA